MRDLFGHHEPDHNPGGKVRIPLPSGIASTQPRFSRCQQYRYTLERLWGKSAFERPVIWIMMNPSTADHRWDDPTVAKCRRYAHKWGFNRMIVLNAMAFRATAPRDLLRVSDPVGPENHELIRETIAAEPDALIVCAWGKFASAMPALRPHEAAIVELLRSLERAVHTLKLNGDGSPGHPLYISGDAVSEPWQPIAFAD